MSEGIRFDVDPASLEQTGLTLTAAARAVDELRGHPGVLRGRAADAGDPALAQAIIDLASTWGWGLERLADEARRWGTLLQTAGSLYTQADRPGR